METMTFRQSTLTATALLMSFATFAQEEKQFDHREGKDGFALCTIALKASKEIKITDSFSLPVFAQAIIAPNQDNVFLVFGLSIK